MAIRYFAIATGIVYLLVGLMGFIPGVNQDAPPGTPELAVDTMYGYLFGLFPVNILHNLVHLGIGAWGVMAYSRGIPGSRAFARGLAVLYGLFAVMGVIPFLATTFGLVPLFGHDVWLHALTALAAAYFGWMHKVDLSDRVADRHGDLVGRH